MRTVTTLFCFFSLVRLDPDALEMASYQRVRFPVSPSSWISGDPGTTVGMGAMPVLVGRAGKLSKSGTIMMIWEMRRERAGRWELEGRSLKLEARSGGVKCMCFGKSGFGRDDDASSPQQESPLLV